MNDSEPFGAIHGITEEDFWSQLHVPEGATAPEHLAEAIRLGLAGEKDRAYAALTDYYRTGRSDAWALAQEAATASHAPTRAKIRKTIALSLADITDTSPDAIPLVSPVIRPSPKVSLLLSGIHTTLHTAMPLTYHLIRTGDPTVRPFLCQLLAAGRRNSTRLTTRGHYPIFEMLAGHEQYQFFWWTWLALAHTGPVPTATAEAALKLLLGLGRAMRQHTDRYIVHNIYTAACYAFLFLTRTVREFKHAPEWDHHALAMLDRDFDRAWFADGGHLERNWGYGYYTLSRLTNAWKFARRTGGLGEFEAHFADGLRRAYRFYAATLDASDRTPGFGDEGGPTVRGEVLDEALASGLFPPGTPRDLGVDRSKSCLMATSGVAILRNGADKESTFADITFGDFAGWHSHMDLLSMDLRAMGDILLQEVPRFGPYEHPMDVLWRGTEAHNQLLVDTFHYDARPCIGQDIAWHSDDRVDYFSGYHTAYRQVPPQEGWRTHHASADLIVRRTVVFVKNPGYLAVLDAVFEETTGRFNRSTSAWWHSPRRFRPLGQDRARTLGKKACLLVWAYPESLRRMETGIDFTREDSAGQPHGDMEWHSLRTRCWMPLPYDGCLGFFTVLFPFQGKPPAVRITPLPLSGAPRYRAGAFSVTTPAGTDVLALNPERMTNLKFRGQSFPQRALITLSNRRGTSRVE